MWKGAGNEVFRQAVINGEANAQTLNKELIHFIYRLLFLFIIEDRNLVYNIGAPDTDNDYDQKVRCQDIYKNIMQCLAYVACQSYPICAMNATATYGKG